MIASLRAAPLLSALAALAPSLDDGGDSSLWSALAAVLMIFGALWVLAKVMQSGTIDGADKAETAPSSRRAVAAPVAARKRSGSRSRIPRRVIRLHEVTPGQSRHEYNVGDEWGTRGTALVRAA